MVQYRYYKCMKISKILLVLLFPLIAQFVVSCCDCIAPLIEHYTNNEILVDHLDNRDSTPIIATSNTVLKNAYGIRIHLNRKKTACINSRIYRYRV